jgi:predicted ATPase
VTQPDRTPFITRVRLRNYKSIAECDITLGPLTVLVGPNAAGKSNFVDALHFVRDALTLSAGNALTARGGLNRVLHREPASDGGPAEPASSFAIQINLALPADKDTGEVQSAAYAFEIGPDPAGLSSHAVLSEMFWLDQDGELRLVFEREPRDAEGAFNLPDQLGLPSRRFNDVLFVAALLSTEFYDLDSAALRAVDDDTTRYRRLGPRGEHPGPGAKSVLAGHAGG